MKLRSCIISLMIACIAFPGYAKLSLPIKTIGKNQYYTYKVKKKETMYGISNKLGIDIADIIKYNPSAKDGLRTNQTLFFPVSSFNKEQSSQSKPTIQQITNISHTVKKGETLYGLSKLYNVSISDITKANPSVSSGLRTGDIITIPQAGSISISASQSPSNTGSNNKPLFHKIKAGETLFSVSRLYNTSINNILELNPGISEKNFRTDEVIRIHANSAKTVEVVKEFTEFHTYVADKDDSFSSIAKEQNISEESLRAANPDTKNVKKNSIINIPKTSTQKVTVRQSEIEKESSSNFILSNKGNESDTINVAVILPFMLNAKKPTTLARNNTEFFKGFMLAVDTVQQSHHKHFNIHAFDNKNSLSTTDSILNLQSLKGMDMIIAPSDLKQLDAINKFCQENCILSVNSLSVKDESYATNPYTLQSNIPPTYLSAEILEWYNKTFKTHKVIFINDANHDTKDICSDLKVHFKNSQKEVLNISLNSNFNEDALSTLLNPGSKYIVIPSSASKETLQRIIPVLKHVKANRIDVDFALLGYPEYTTYLFDFKEDFHNLDTYIYSRFFYDSEDYNTKSLEEAYRRWYGEEMRYTAPIMGILGFDTGVFFLETLCKGNNEFNKRKLQEYNGVQTSFKFERISNWSGFINKNLQFIHFTPTGTIEK